MRRFIPHLLVALLTFLLGVAAFQVVNYLALKFIDTKGGDVVLSGTPLRPPNVETVFCGNEDEQAVYRTVLKTLVKQPGTELFVLSTQTAVFDLDGRNVDFDDYLTKKSPEAKISTLMDYKLKNSLVGQLSVTSLDLNYVLITDEVFQSFFSKGGEDWAGFYKRFPHSTGLVQLSKVGFNPEHDQAFLYVANSCGGLCGVGEYVLLVKETGSWRVLRTEMLWVS